MQTPSLPGPSNIGHPAGRRHSHRRNYSTLGTADTKLDRPPLSTNPSSAGHSIVTGRKYSHSFSHINSPLATESGKFQVLSRDLSSHATAAGHAAWLTHHRAHLLAALASSRASAARYRGLSFRLAARVAARDARLAAQEREKQAAGQDGDDAVLTRLREAVSMYERQGATLLKMLIGDGEEDDGRTMEKPMSPPESGAASPDLRAGAEFARHEEQEKHLPDEILEICKARVQSLLRECQLSRDTLALMEETEKGLKSDVQDREAELAELVDQKTKSDRELQRVRGELDEILEKQRRSEQTVGHLKRGEDKLEELIAAHRIDKERLNREKDALRKKSNALDAELSQLQGELQQEYTKARFLEQSKASMEQVVKRLEEKQQSGESDVRQARLDLGVYKQELEKLEENDRDQKVAIAALEEQASASKRDLELKLQASNEKWTASEQRIVELEAQVCKAQADIQESAVRVEREQEIQKSLERAKHELQETITEQEHAYSQLERSSKDLDIKLEESRVIQWNFVTAAKKLRKELDGEQEKTFALMRTEHELRAQVSDYEETVARSRLRIQTLEEDLVDARTEAEDAAGLTTSLEDQLRQFQRELKEMKVLNEKRQATDKASNDALTTARNEIEQLKGELKEAAEQKTLLRRELRDAMKESTELSEKQDAALSSHEQLREKYEALQGQAQHLDSRVLLLSDDKSRAEERVKVLKNKLNVAIREKEEAQAGLKVAQEESFAAKAQQMSLVEELNRVKEGTQSSRRSSFIASAEFKDTATVLIDDLNTRLRIDRHSLESSEGSVESVRITDVASGEDQLESSVVEGAENEDVGFQSKVPEPKEALASPKATGSAAMQTTVESPVDRIENLSERRSSYLAGVPDILNTSNSPSDNLAESDCDSGLAQDRFRKLQAQIKAQGAALDQFHRQFRVLQRTSSESGKRVDELEAENGTLREEAAAHQVRLRELEDLLLSQPHSRPPSRLLSQHSDINKLKKRRKTDPELLTTFNDYRSKSAVFEPPVRRSYRPATSHGLIASVAEAPIIPRHPSTPLLSSSETQSPVDTVTSSSRERGSTISTAHTRVPSSHSMKALFGGRNSHRQVSGTDSGESDGDTNSTQGGLPRRNGSKLSFGRGGSKKKDHGSLWRWMHKEGGGSQKRVVSHP